MHLTLKGDQLQKDIRSWLSPPDPSRNQNIARGAHHNGTAEWFTQGDIFERWKASGSLLWVHGKRTNFCHDPHLLLIVPATGSCSGLWKEYTLVSEISPGVFTGHSFWPLARQSFKELRRNVILD